MNSTIAEYISEAGTGFMDSLAPAMARLQYEGYTEILTPRFDHFESRNGTIKLFPRDIQVDGFRRFENSSDPDDQSIMYAISAPELKIKGLYVDSYGLYHDELSQEIIDKLSNCPENRIETLKGSYVGQGIVNS